MNELDVQQQAAVDHQEGPCRVVAGPGSGKTRCLSKRIIRLIESGIPQNQILAVTFSKAAATEMLERVAKALDIKPSEVKVKICTLHSLGYGIFMSHKALVGYKGPHTVSDGRCSGVLRKLLKTPYTPYEEVPFATARTYINTAKRMDLSPADLERRPDSDARLVRLYEDFEKQKRELGLVSFDDMIFLGWRILRDHKMIREQYQRKFKLVLLDEAHDTDLVQFRIISALSDPEKNLWIVDDERQSIYGFRGADPQLCRDFGAHKDCRTIYLAVNYRSRPAIVALYKRLIQQDPAADQKFIDAIRAVREQGDRTEPVLQRFMFDFEESNYVAAKIRAIRAREKDASIAVLYRTNKQSRAVEESLRAAKITYVVRGSSSFFRLKEVKGAIAFLKFVENPDDNKNFEEMILTPCRGTYGLGKMALDILRKSAKDGSLFESWDPEETFRGQRFAKPAHYAYEKLHQIIYQCQDSMDVAKQLQVIYDIAGLVRDEFDDADANVDNVPAENLRELLKAAKAFNSRDEFLNYVAGFSGESNASDAVELMSCHRSKGLEYDFVFIIGVDEDTLPHKFAADPWEELRLAYVAVSRAREEVYILSHDRPSRFFPEWPAEVNLTEANPLEGIAGER